jgi:hypothetical protein
VGALVAGFGVTVDVPAVVAGCGDVAAFGWSYPATARPTAVTRAAAASAQARTDTASVARPVVVAGPDDGGAAAHPDTVRSSAASATRGGKNRTRVAYRLRVTRPA